MEKAINCRFVEDNFFITRNYGKNPAICIDTNDMELIEEIKNILIRRAYKILEKNSKGEQISYSELSDTCKTIEQIDESIKDFERYKAEEQEDESCTVTN